MPVPVISKGLAYLLIWINPGVSSSIKSTLGSTFGLAFTLFLIFLAEFSLLVTSPNNFFNFLDAILIFRENFNYMSHDYTTKKGPKPLKFKRCNTSITCSLRTLLLQNRNAFL